MSKKQKKKYWVSVKESLNLQPPDLPNLNAFSKEYKEQTYLNYTYDDLWGMSGTPYCRSYFNPINMIVVGRKV
jgi:hypothetical protein